MAILTLATADVFAAELVNLSYNGQIPLNSATNPLIVSFVASGWGYGKDVLIRAVGPTLANFGVPGTEPDPRMTVYYLSPYGGWGNSGSNDNWNDFTPNLAPYFSSVGAFPLANASKDSAMLKFDAHGTYSVHVKGSDTSSNNRTVLVELYDAETSNLSNRLVNISVRNDVGPGKVAIGGFVLEGSGNTEILIRAMGPALSTLGVPSVMEDPLLELYEGQTSVAINDNWYVGASTGAILATSRGVGAFSFGLPNATGVYPQTKDAALLVTLPPGLRTVHLKHSPYDTGSGNHVLLEIYKVQFAIPGYVPDFWNDGVPGGTKQFNSNCYNYALNRVSPPNPNNPYQSNFAVPGWGLGVTTNGFTPPEMHQALLRDGLIPTDATSVSPSGRMRIAAFVDSSGGAYHFYRQDSGGGWSQKHNHNAVTNRVNADGTGPVITDPISAAATTNTNVFVGYYFVPSGGGQGEGYANMRSEFYNP